ncbi:hypothetical protein Mal48_45150 [Thalassoglobus polymorphus]|uniref:Uncharacterized protein n=1 Tax=Thalassoglobus polymorphus TaxID=2527994 RepID=A0A517QUB9_9PLAN|nr:hypothetical protein Mal48_45150 [Thalassoglobus polymorphus]
MSEQKTEGIGRRKDGTGEQAAVAAFEPVYISLEHLSKRVAGSASWRTVILLEKCVLHGHTLEQTALAGVALLLGHTSMNEPPAGSSLHIFSMLPSEAYVRS